MTGKTIRSFNADEDLNQLINDANIKKGELSIWFNDKIKKGVLYDKNPTQEVQIKTEVSNLRVRI